MIYTALKSLFLVIYPKFLPCPASHNFKVKPRSQNSETNCYSYIKWGKNELILSLLNTFDNSLGNKMRIVTFHGCLIKLCKIIRVTTYSHAII